MSDFSARARMLVDRIELDRSDPRVSEELDALRGLWRSLSPGERAAAADAARALAQAQTGPVRQMTLIDDDTAAQRALRGLDRLDVDAPPERRYDGPRDPDALLAHFGLEDFRPGQRDVVAAALAGRDSLVVMPTGGGKSLCYQLPGIASEALTVVVSPLIALMADQYRRLLLGGHPAAMIASGMDAEPPPGRWRMSATAARGSCCARRSGLPPRPFWRRSRSARWACSPSTRPIASRSGAMTSVRIICACAASSTGSDLRP